MHQQTGHLTLIDHNLFLDGSTEPIKLTPIQAEILFLLMCYPNQMVSRATIMQEVWQTDHFEDMRSLGMHISALRRKIEVDPRHPRIIVTERKVGYRLRV